MPGHNWCTNSGTRTVALFPAVQSVVLVWPAVKVVTFLTMPVEAASVDATRQVEHMQVRQLAPLLPSKPCTIRMSPDSCPLRNVRCRLRREDEDVPAARARRPRPDARGGNLCPRARRLARLVLLVRIEDCFSIERNYFANNLFVSWSISWLPSYGSCVTDGLEHVACLTAFCGCG